MKVETKYNFLSSPSSSMYICIQYLYKYEFCLFFFYIASIQVSRFMLPYHKIFNQYSIHLFIFFLFIGSRARALLDRENNTDRKRRLRILIFHPLIIKTYNAHNFLFFLITAISVSLEPRYYRKFVKFLPNFFFFLSS